MSRFKMCLTPQRFLLNALCSAALLSSFRLAVSSHAAPSLPSLPATLKALSHPRGALDALRYLHALPKTQLELLRSEALSQALERVSFDESASLHTRTWAIALLTRLGEARPALTALFQREERVQGEERLQGEERVVLVRALARHLRGLGRADLLSEALTHLDPEVRASAAAAGAEPRVLCELLSASREPWPQVRYAAARGLERVGGRGALCLSRALQDIDELTQERAARALGALALDEQWAPTNEERVALIKGLVALAGDPRAPLEPRKSAFVSLARWGELTPCERALKAHLTKGGIVPLALASLQGIMSAPLPPEERAQKLSHALKESPSLEVRLAAARWLARLNTPSARSALEREADRVGGREGARYQELMRSVGGRAPREAVEERGELAPSLEEEERLGL